MELKGSATWIMGSVRFPCGVLSGQGSLESLPSARNQKLCSVTLLMGLSCLLYDIFATINQNSNTRFDFPESNIMVVWGLSNITDALQKRLCRFLIHRYLSDFLKSSINLEQLSATLYGGIACVSDVDMDVQKINETFESMKIPFTVVEGYIGEVNITVPWQYILVKSVDLEVKQLQLTLQLQQFADEPAGDIVASMFGSVMGSLATSMELAQSFLNQDEVTNEAEDKGIEQFAEVIDAVISRFRLIFNDAIIRLEDVPDPESGLCTALELRIDWIELIDEQLESEAFNAGTVTSQPRSLSAIPDFNKLFHVKGIRLYTDIFTKPEMKDLSEENMSASTQVITSMYLRREKEKTRKKLSASSDSSDGHCEKSNNGLCTVQMSTASTIYESCYSRNSCVEDEFPSATSSPLSSSSSTTLESNPVVFASFSGSVETVIVREISLNFDGLCVFLTPSQLNILKIFFAAIGRPSSTSGDTQCSLGKPMCMQDYQQVEAELQTRILPANQMGTDFQHGNWGGSMMFYDAQRKPSVASIEEQMANVSLNLNDVTDGRSAKFPTEILRSDYSPKTVKNSDTVSDVINVKATICNVVFIITHKDYLGQDEVRNRGTENIADMINSYKDLAEGFFKIASSLNFGVQLNELSRSTKHLYGDDHLKFIGEGVAFDYNQIKGREIYSFLMNLEALDAELSEVLSSASSSTESEEIIKLFSFCDNESTAEKSRRLMVAIESGRNPQHYDVTVNLATCESELDISIIDRISSILVTKPFHTYPFLSLIHNINDMSRGLKTDFLFTAMQDANCTPLTMAFVIDCPEWDLNLRIPVADLRHAELSRTRAPYWKRHLHKESVRLTLIDARVEVPAFDMSSIRQYGTVIISASAVNGSFNLDGKIGATCIDSLFLYAGCSEACGGGCVSLKLSYDKRNSSLESTSTRCNDAGYSCASQYDIEGETDMKVEGPFSKCVIRNENRMIIVVGSTKEMLEFGENCLVGAGISCELTVPVLRVHLPSRHYYEVIYNRLVNDLLMWQPSSPIFNSPDRQRDVEVSGDEVFQLCSAQSESNVSCSHGSTPTVNALSNEKSHDFCLLANINDGRVLIETEFEDGVLKKLGQVGAVLLKTQIMAVNGFHGNRELSYFYSTSKLASFFHKNLIGDVVPYERCVLKKDFAEHFKQGIQAEPIVDEEICLLEEEDNFAIAVRTDFHFSENFKNMLVGIGIRNTMLHLRPCRNSEQFWINQMISFFDVEDYGIPGYEVPQITTELHMHLSSSLLAYEHYFENPSPSLSLRVVLGSCDVSSRIMQDLEIYKFECIFEQLKLFASCTPDAQIIAYQNEPRKFAKLGSKFIHMLSVSMLQLEVMATKSFGTADRKSKKRSPVLEVRCKNDLLKLWACSDSLCLVVNAMAELLDSQTSEIAAPKADLQASVEKSTLLNSERQTTTEQMANIEKMVRSAVSQSGHEIYDFPADSPQTVLDDSSMPSNAVKDFIDMTEKRPRDAHGTLGIDEGFCLLDEIPGSGITADNGKPWARFLFTDDEPPITYDDYLTKFSDTSNRSVLFTMSKDHIPLIKYSIDDVSLELHLYGGADFSTSKPPSKPYSISNAGKLRRDNSPIGGHYRDYSAHVELRFSKASLPNPISQYYMSLYLQHVWDQSFPRHSQSPMFSIRLFETPQHEGKMKVSLLPLRINADQDTLEFLEDYVNDLSGGVAVLQTEKITMSKIPEKPWLEVRLNRNTNSTQYAKGVCLNEAESCMEVTVQNDSFSNEFTGRQPEFCNSEKQRNSLMTYDLLNLHIRDDFHLDDANNDILVSERPDSANNLFDESGPLTDDIMDVMGHSPILSSRNDIHCSKMERTDSNVHVVLPNKCEEANTQKLKCDLDKQEKKNDETIIANQHNKSGMEINSWKGDSVVKGKIYFKEFTFSPSATIRLDLNGKRMRPDQGWILGLLVGLSDFKCTEIRLKELSCTRGLLGYDRCIRFALNAWLNDINNKQLVQFITSYGPIKSLVEIGFGIRDLFLMPVNEYCREEGHIVKGLQKGAESFGISTATAAVDMLQRMVGVVQSVAELAFDIVSPEYPIYRHRRNMIDYTALRSPNDIREGFNMALEAIGREISDTALDFQLAALEDQASGYSTVRGFLRQAPTTVLRPIIAVSKATVNILGGVRNQMKPDSHRYDEHCFSCFKEKILGGKLLMSSVCKRRNEAPTKDWSEREKYGKGMRKERREGKRDGRKTIN
uniref:Autophagy-related protein 2 n=1 Tax=Setaria digitata TaxID=48799 RepID=A0A915PI46_9BILA